MGKSQNKGTNVSLRLSVTVAGCQYLHLHVYTDGKPANVPQWVNNWILSPDWRLYIQLQPVDQRQSEMQTETTEQDVTESCFGKIQHLKVGKILILTGFMREMWIHPLGSTISSCCRGEDEEEEGLSGFETSGWKSDYFY